MPTSTGLGRSTATGSSQAAREAALEAVRGLDGREPTAAFVFATAGHDPDAVLDGVADVVGDAPVTRCAESRLGPTSGPEMADGVDVLAVASDEITFEAVLDGSEGAPDVPAEAMSLDQATLDATQEGLLVVDRKGRIVAYNDRFQEMWGFPDDVLAGGDPDEAIDHVLGRLEDPDAFTELLDELFEDPGGEREDVVRFEDGRVVEATSRPKRQDGDVVGRVFSFHDITRLKEIQQDLEDHAEKLQRSNRELEQFARAVSHDLKNPLTVVAGNLELALREDDTPDRDRLEEALDGARRMEDLIDGLLEFARLDAEVDEPEPVDVGEVLESVRTDLQSLIVDHAGSLKIGPMPTVLADASHVYQLFLNLVGNAIKFHGDDPPTVEIRAERVGADWRFEVEDNGVGIDLDEEVDIFEIFQRSASAEDTDGTGLGLALCKKIVERVGGEIGVDSTPGEGSTFWFTLPAADDDATVEDGSMQDHPAVPPEAP